MNRSFSAFVKCFCVLRYKFRDSIAENVVSVKEIKQCFLSYYTNIPGQNSEPNYRVQPPIIFLYTVKIMSA